MRNRLSLLAIVILFTACNKINSDNMPPGKAVLVFPAKDALCTTGINVTATQSTVTFSWNTSDHTDVYELTVKNLVTGVYIVKTTITNHIDVTLAANTPYTWHIKSSASASSTDGVLSDEWRFYNAGLGIVAYAPFPATMVTPTYGQTATATAGKVTLTWTGSDVDNDILNYTVYCDKNATPSTQVLIATNVNTVSASVTSGSTYYWYVVTLDKQGNSSKSDIYKFTVN